jgi:hypothetical protein
MQKNVFSKVVVQALVIGQLPSVVCDVISAAAEFKVSPGRKSW